MSFSIIVPVHDAAATLERALRSIAAMTARHVLEAIVVDDASNDGSLDLAYTLARRWPWLRVIATGRNGGPGTARNLGIDAACGRWLLFLDADDELAPDCLDAIAAHLTQAQQEPELLAFDFRLVPPGADSRQHTHGRRDDLTLLATASHHERLVAFLKNRIDPSVIFLAFRLDFLHSHRLRFRAGLHEDVDFTFAALLEASSLEVLARPLYIKRDTPGSIVNTLGVSHIEGYFDALSAIGARLAAAPASPDLEQAFRIGVINVAASRLSRLLRQNIVKRDTSEEILTALHTHVSALLPQETWVQAVQRPAGFFATKYEILLGEFMVGWRNRIDITDLLARLKVINAKSWSCYDLHHSVFFAPDEVRTCCKRFFVDGKQKGDVVILRRGKGPNFAFSYQDIIEAKRRLHLEINRDNAPTCSGCPFLAFSDWGEPLAAGVRYLSLEYHSLCNMRCIYCDEIYYGGKKPAYDISAAVDSLAKAGALDGCEYIVWGGGEPVIEKHFQSIAAQLAAHAPHVRQRIITNCTLFSPFLAQLLQRDQAFIVTSLDAGTPATFQAIRRYDKFDKVLGILGRYAELAPANVIIKYILLPENWAAAELDAFIGLIAHFSLQGCNFQLSCDFKHERMGKEEILAMARLYLGLRRLNVRFQFVDDLIWQRLPERETLIDMVVELERAGLAEAIARPHHSGERIAIWGTGAQAELMLHKSTFLARCEIDCFIDPRPSRIGTVFLGKPVRAPEHLHASSYRVIIAAVQSAPFIHRALLALGISRERLIDRLPL